MIEAFRQPVEGRRVLNMELPKLTLHETEITRLRQALDDTDLFVRSYAAIALADLGATDGDELLLYLLSVVDYKSLPGPQFLIYEEAVPRIGERRLAQAVEQLLASIDETHEPGPNDLRQEAAWALGEIGDTRAAPRLLQMVREDFFLDAQCALEALRKLGPEIAAEAEDAWNARENKGPGHQR